jgi:nitrate/TMAO reductase-like tetraheme cytochrome c subunit
LPNSLTRLPLLGIVAFACAFFATVILAYYLVRRPPLTAAVKVWLLMGLGVFPIGVAFSGNVQGFEATKQRTFCGSCHVMTAYQFDSDDPTSTSLASRHGRNKLFGDENCYVCHADYGMFGTVATKLGGLGHVQKYYLGGYRAMTLEEARAKIHINRPYPNDNCMQCHSTNGKVWLEVNDHRGSLQAVRDGRMSCASSGCHGYAHPFSKAAPSASPGASAAPPRLP